MAEFAVTPHINVQDDIGFGKTVLMPGDPLRAKFIAENFFENPVLVNNVRGVNGYTGWYKGVKVSVMASGMGMPAIGIYSHELFNFFGVENIIRVGSAGSIQDHINVYDIVLAQGACTDSAWQNQFHLPGNFAPIASYELLSEAVKACEAAGATYHVGNVNSSDVFYGDHVDVPAGLDSVYGLKKMGVMALEMEAAALYMNAARYGKRGLCICTISDHVLKGVETTAQERQTAFTQMMQVALDVAVAMESKRGGFSVGELQGKLREIAQETIRRCCIPKQAEYCGRSGIRQVFLPAGDEKYGSFWPVDAIFSSRCGLMDNELLKDIIDIIFTHGRNDGETRYLMHGLEVPPYAIADHINLDGKPVFFPGTYSSGEDQGDGAYGYYPPLNNLYLVSELVDRYISQSGDTEILEKQYCGKPLKICLKEAFFAPYALDPRTQLCCGREDRHVVDWTYCDAVKKSGLFLAPSLMRAQAAQILAKYFPEEAERYDAIREQIVKNLIAELYDEKTGWFYSATGIGRQKDIWGTAYGVYSGVLPDAVCRKAAQALSEAYTEGSATCRGYVRHILTTEDYGKESAWENCIAPYNSYMNGGYWATPSGWFAAALYRHDPSLARKFAEEFVEFTLENRADGAPYEWFHPQTGNRSGRHYGTSGTALYAAVKDWSVF